MRTTVTPVSTKDDSKDFVEHLRTVHFTLLAVCLALVVISLSPSPEVLRKANEQLNEITSAQQLWMAKGESVLDRAIDAEINAETKGQTENTLLKGSKLRLSTGVWQFAALPPYFCVSGPASIARKVQTEYTNGDGNIRRVYYLHPPDDLTEFRAIWDGQFSINRPLDLSDDILVSPPKENVFSPTTYRVVKGVNNIKDDSIPSNKAMQFSLYGFGEFGRGKTRFEMPENDKPCSYAGIDPESHENVLIPVTGQLSSDFKLRDSMTETFGQKNKWINLDFATAFRELDQETTGFQDLDFAHLHSILELEEKNSPGELFEAFGVKFPKETTTQWGILLILGIQLYFCIHLAEYGRRHFAQPSVAWVGVYSGVIPQLTFYATAIVVPVGVLLYLLFFGRSRPFNSRIVADSLLAVCLVLAGTAGRISRSIGQERRQQSSSSN